MKKLFTLLSLFVVIGMSATVFAQSTGSAPSPGAKHSYSVTTTSGSTYTWSVTKGDLTTDAGVDATLSSTSGNEIDITWGTGLTLDSWYYVHVVEEDANGCKNEKVLPVQISASDFYLTVTAAKDKQCYDEDVVPAIDGSDASIINYDHGNATIVFTVTPTGLSNSYTGYSFNLADLTVPTGYTSSVEFSGNASISSGVVTVTDNSAVTVTYTVDNTNTYNNTTDASGAAADFTATAVISGGKSSNGVADNGDGVYNDATDVARPHTTTIQTN